MNYSEEAKGKNDNAQLLTLQSNQTMVVYVQYQK